MSDRIAAAELAQMNATLDDLKMRGWPGTGLSLGDQRRLIRDVSRLNIELIRERERSEELRAALRDARNEALEEAARMHEQLYVAHDDAMTAIVKYRDAIRAIKARAALGEEVQ